MSIAGLSILTEDNCIYCCVEDFSDQLQEVIKSELNKICYGRAEVEQYALEIHSYKNTLVEFIKRYSTKSENIKKGMMGELLGHLIINKILPQLETISIFFNKEEQSIRKGFDLTYIELGKNIIWYGEVKSGELNGKEKIDKKNSDLIHTSKSGILDFFSGNRPNLWTSVINDVGLTIAQKDRKKIKELLDADIKDLQTQNSINKNAILISVVFHDSGNKITFDSIKKELEIITADQSFEGVIIFSIQKSTYTKIAEFLESEAQKN